MIIDKPKSTSKIQFKEKELKEIVTDLLDPIKWNTK